MSPILSFLRKLIVMAVAGVATSASAEVNSPHFGDHIFAHGFDDTQQIQVDSTVLDIGEAGSAPLGVRLALAPMGNVTVFLESGDVGAATVSPASLTFTPANFATFQSATVSGADDVDSSDEVVPMLIWSSGINDEFFTVNVSDDDRVLSVLRAGTGNGTVTSSPAGINCGADCTEPYVVGTMVSLTATPAVGSTFAGWSGGGCSGTGTCNFTMSAATSVTATFTLNTYALSVIRAGTGVGTVTSSPAGISCGADCSETYGHGTMVALTASPAAGSTFAGWSGDCTGTGTCNVSMTAARSVTATFTQNTYSLTVSRAGTGGGTVTSSPAGINCGADCFETYNHGTMVALTASPAAGSTFSGWSGGGCSGTGTCNVTMSAATSVTATFTQNTYSLTVSRAGTGGGTVTSSPAGINCGADCFETYNHGTMVALTASPAAGSTFSGWSGGGCSGVGTCNTTITAATSVTASFSL